jgi:hypothetical protein
VNKYFLAILRIEMDDLTEDLQQLIHKCKEDFAAEQITERVYRENLALYNNEMMGIADFNHLINSIEYAEFESLDELIDHLWNAFKRLSDTRSLAGAIQICIKRKMQKVKLYVNP